MVQPNVGVVPPTSGPSFFIPNFFTDFKQDINTITESGYAFQEERVKEAAKRALCSLGVVLGAAVLGFTAWNLIWYTLSLATKIAIGAGLYFVSRDMLERYKGEQGVIAELAEYQSRVQGIFKFALAIRNYAASVVEPAPPETTPSSTEEAPVSLETALVNLPGTTTNPQIISAHADLFNEF